VATTTADASGQFAFTNVASGTYTLSASGTDGAGNTYAGTTAITVAGTPVSATFNLYANPPVVPALTASP
jgi:hypothetical protein